jgi:hypothetical protein
MLEVKLSAKFGIQFPVEELEFFSLEWLCGSPSLPCAVPLPPEKWLEPEADRVFTSNAKFRCIVVCFLVT